MSVHVEDLVYRDLGDSGMRAQEASARSSKQQQYQTYHQESRSYTNAQDLADGRIISGRAYDKQVRKEMQPNGTVIQNGYLGGRYEANTGSSYAPRNTGGVASESISTRQESYKWNSDRAGQGGYGFTTMDNDQRLRNEGKQLGIDHQRVSTRALGSNYRSSASSQRSPVIMNGSIPQDPRTSRLSMIDNFVRRFQEDVGIINLRLDEVLLEINQIEARGITILDDQALINDLLMELERLEGVIDALSGDIEYLKLSKDESAIECSRQVLGLQQRRIAYLDRLCSPPVMGGSKGFVVDTAGSGSNYHQGTSYMVESRASSRAGTRPQSCFVIDGGARSTSSRLGFVDDRVEVYSNAGDNRLYRVESMPSRRITDMRTALSAGNVKTHIQTNIYNHYASTGNIERMGSNIGKIQEVKRIEEQVDERYVQKITSIFRSCEEHINWVTEILDELNNMQYVADVDELERMFERAQVTHRDIMDFRQEVDLAIARQAEVSAEDSAEYCEMLARLERSYQELLDASTTRLVDMDVLLGWIRSALAELKWIKEHQEPEILRNWANLDKLDLPVLEHYYKQLLQEIELHEVHFNSVYNQGTALLKQNHPARDIIEAYLESLQCQWNWLLALAKCLEVHLQDAIGLNDVADEAKRIDEAIVQDINTLNTKFTRSAVSLDEGAQLLKEIQDISQIFDRHEQSINNLMERCRKISPLWMRGERITNPILIHALVDYNDPTESIRIRQGDQCMLLDNSDHVYWRVRLPGGSQVKVPSVIFRIPPPDPRLMSLIERLRARLDSLVKLWHEKRRMIRYLMLIDSMKAIRAWDLKKFLSIDPDKRDGIMKSLNSDTNKLYGEFDPNDPFARRLMEELRLTNEHYRRLLEESTKRQGLDISELFEKRSSDLLERLEKYWRELNERSRDNIPLDIKTLKRHVIDHQNFEGALQALDGEVSAVRDLFQQLEGTTPRQMALMKRILELWECLWELSRAYVQRLKACEAVLNALAQAVELINQHEVLIAEFTEMPSDQEALRRIHSRLMELQLQHQQKQPIIDQLSRACSEMRQNVSRSRPNVPSHPDIDRMEDEVQAAIVRWENLGFQITERLKTVDIARHIITVYRPSYDNELSWLNRIERMINDMRRPDLLRPEEYESEMNRLMIEYNGISDHAKAIENVNHEGGRFMREAKTYDSRLASYYDSIRVNNTDLHVMVTRRHLDIPGHEVVRRELEELNRRFALLPSLIMERYKLIQTLVERWRISQQKTTIHISPPPIIPPRPYVEPPRIASITKEVTQTREVVPPRIIRPMPPVIPPRIETVTKEIHQTREVILDIKQPTIVGGGVTIEEYVEGFDIVGQPGDRAKITEQEDEMQMYEEWTETKTQFYEEQSRQNVKTDQVVTFMEAMRDGLLNLRSGGGEFYDLVSGTKISLREAVERGYVSESFQGCLDTKYGIRDPSTGEEITLHQAVHRGIYDPEFRQLRDPVVGDLLSLDEAVMKKVISFTNTHKLVKMGILKLPPVSLESAVEQELINVETGEFVGRISNERMPLTDALKNEYITLSCTLTPMLAISLSDAIAKNYIDSVSATLTDKNTGKSFSLKDATSRNDPILNLNIREVFSGPLGKRVSLGDAVAKNVIDTRNGMFTDPSGKAISLGEAYYQSLIQKPLSLREVYQKGLLDSAGRFVDPATKKRLPLIEAVAEYLLDPEVEQIWDSEESQTLSISDALEKGILQLDGSILAGPEQRVSINQALDRDLIKDPVRHTLFDVKAIRNTKEQSLVSFREALDTGIIVLPAGDFTDSEARERLSLADAVNRGMVDRSLHTALSTMSGITHPSGRELTIFDAVCDGIIDARKGTFVDRARRLELRPRDAYEQKLVTLRGALFLEAILDVPSGFFVLPRAVKLATRRQRKASAVAIMDVSGLPSPKEQIRSTIGEAMQKGLMDSRSEKSRHVEQFTRISSDVSSHSGSPLPYANTAVPASTYQVQRTSPQHNLSYVLSSSLDFDGGSGQIRDPSTGHSLSLQQGMDSGLVDQSSLIYESKTGKVHVLREAFESRVLDSSGGYVDDKSGARMSLRDAVSRGHLALIDSPEKAGTAIDEAMKRLQVQSPSSQQVSSSYGSDVGQSGATSKGEYQITRVQYRSTSDKVPQLIQSFESGTLSGM